MGFLILNALVIRLDFDMKWNVVISTCRGMDLVELIDGR
jgi:hypothetical protein